MTHDHALYITQIDDGTFLAASIDAPRFCVSGATADEARAKAGRARSYVDQVKGVALKSPARRGPAQEAVD